MADRREADLVRVFRALGDPNRLAIYQLVRSAPADDGMSPADLRNTVSEIARQFDLSLSTVSHHIRELRNAGLLRCERRGQHIHCHADPEMLALVGDFVDRG